MNTQAMSDSQLTKKIQEISTELNLADEQSRYEDYSILRNILVKLCDEYELRHGPAKEKP